MFHSSDTPCSVRPNVMFSVTAQPLNERKRKKKRRGETNLGSTVRSLLQTETNEGRVSYFDQDVVYTIHMDVLDPPPLQVIDDALVPQGSVQTSISIWRTNILVNTQTPLGK